MSCDKVKAKIDSLDDLRELSKLLTQEEKNHFSACDDCRQIVQQYGHVDKLLLKMRSISPPAEITQNYMAGLYQKMETRTQSDASRPRKAAFPRLRLAWAGLAIVALVSIGVWRWGDFTEPVAPADDLTSDSLDYFLESFNEVSSVNPINVVIEMDYDWTEYEIPDIAKE